MFICAKSPTRQTNQKIRISSRASTASTLFQQPPIETRSTKILEQAGKRQVSRREDHANNPNTFEDQTFRLRRYDSSTRSLLERTTGCAGLHSPLRLNVLSRASRAVARQDRRNPNPRRSAGHHWEWLSLLRQSLQRRLRARLPSPN
jgi:hypothetical protein